ncbi:MAG: DedA family protein [Magnetococcales bacterium]|nr:DedA family protein [Magnetococcales bacterium]
MFLAATELFFLSTVAMLKALYLWILRWAASPYAMQALFLTSFVEASFFPAPPYLLLVPMVLATPRRGMAIAFCCTSGTVLGGAFGYFLGYAFWEQIGYPLTQFFGGGTRYEELRALFQEYDAWIILAGGLSPVPYKLFTLSAGAMHASFPIFMLSSILSRGIRFFAVAGLIMWGGEPLRRQIERHLTKIVLGFVLLVAIVLGVLVSWRPFLGGQG